MQPRHPKRRKSWRALIALLGVSAAAQGMRRLLPKLRQRVHTLEREERQELTALVHHQETPRQFTSHTLHFLHDFLIPHPGNDHRPHALCAPALFTYASAAIGIKVITFLLLAVIYPSVADLATIISGDVVLLANSARTEAGLTPLRVDPVLTAAAQAKGEDMLRQGYFAHESPDGRHPWEWIDRSRYDYQYAGENLAMDFTSAGAIHKAFMASSSHRDNIVNPNYADIGVAVVSGTMDGRPVDLLVQMFGARKTTVAAAAAPSPAPKPTPVVAEAPPAPPPPTPTPVAATVPPVSVAPPAPPVSVEPTVASAPPPAPAVEDGLPAAPAADPITLTRDPDLVGLIVQFAQLILVIMLVGVAVALLLNIVIRVRVQHPTVILQSIAVLIIIATMLLSRWHFAERIDATIHIL